MKVICSLAICLLFLASCEKEKEEEIIPEKIAYEFQSLQYFLSEEDGIKLDSFVIESGIVSNNTSNPMSFSIDFEAPVETSQFSLIEQFPFPLIDLDSLKISVPDRFEGDEIITGANLWQYRENKIEELHFPKPNSTGTVVGPHTQLTFDIYAIRQNISTHYTATYKEQKTGQLLEVEGRWKGQQVKGYNFIGTVEILK